MALSERALEARGINYRSWPLSREQILFAVWSTWAAIVVFLATHNLSMYPTTWFDEGSHLHVPTTLVQYGVYADASSEGFRFFGPTASVGPTVMLPIALVFKIAGIGLLQARLVMAAYLIAAVALFAIVVRRGFCHTTAIVASVLLVSSPGVGLLYLGRQVLGEVPAFAFLMLGTLLWWNSMRPGRGEHVRLAGAALAFGLAALTKNQFGLVLVPTLLVLLVANRVYYRQLRFAFFAAPLLAVVGAVGAGYLFQLLPVLGTHDLVSTLTLWREASAGAIFVFAPSRVLSSLKFLAGADVFAFWGIPAILYGLVLMRDRSVVGVQRAFLVTFAVVGLTWYALGSIGWPRYAFPALGITAILVAKMFRDLLAMLRGMRPWTGSRLAERAQPLSISLLLVLGLAAGFPLHVQLRNVMTTSDDSPQRVAAFLDANVPQSAVVETWEPELGFLTDHRYHYPPSGWLDRAVRAKWLGSDGQFAGYDPVREANPAYLVVGRFGKYAGIYTTVLADATTRRMATIGEYEIYRMG